MIGRRLATAALSLLVLAGCEPPPEQKPASPPARDAATVRPTRGAENLPPTRQLEVTVEGQTEQRAATRFASPQDYVIYVLPQIVMTPEEPGQDQAFARVDDGFFMRIQRLPPDADLADQRRNATLSLQDVGPVHELEGEEIFHPYFRDAEFFLHASNSQVSVNRLVIEIDGGLYAVMMHLPNREAAEGITPSFWAMLRSIRTVAPFTPP